MVFGPGDSLHRFRDLLAQMDEKVPQILFERTTASWRATRGYVENVARAITLVAESERLEHRIYNVGDQDALSELEWARHLAAVAGWQGDLVVLSADQAPDHLRMKGNMEQHWVADTGRIRREFGLTELVDRQEALRRTVAWERERRR
jgi:nucleoside-diphosphate-sugar epimerase